MIKVWIAGGSSTRTTPGMNQRLWSPDPTAVDDAEQAMLAIAAHQVDESWFADWFCQRGQAL